MSQRPDSVPHRPEGVSQRPGSVSQRPDFLLFWQDVQDISGYPGGVTARLRRSLAPCRSSPDGLAQSARGRWLNARRGREAATSHRALPTTARPPLKCQHQRSAAATRSPARATRSASCPIEGSAGSHLLLNAGGIEDALLTLEGRWHGFSLGVQLGFFRVRGKCKESVGFARWEAVGNRLEIPFLSRFYADFSRLQRDSADCAAIAEQSQINSDGIAMNSNLHTCRKRGCDAGRMCEVGPPRKRSVPLHFPLFAPTALNGHPALRGIRRPPATT